MGQLNSAKDTIASDTTTSATFEDVDGLSVSITLDDACDVLLLASIQASGSTAAVGSWKLVFDSVDFQALDRQVDSEPGNLTLVDRVANKAAGTYTFKIQHQVSTGTLTTSNATIVAVALHNGSGAVPANDDYVASDTLALAAWTDIAGLSLNITLDKTSHICALLSYCASCSKAGQFLQNRLVINSVSQEEHIREFGAVDVYGCITVYGRTGSALPSGTYEVKAQWYGTAAATFTGEDFSLVAIAGEADSGSANVDIQKDVVASDDTTATSLEDITGLEVTAGLDETAHILSLMCMDTDTDINNTSVYTAISIDAVDGTVMERGHASKLVHGSVGQIERTDSTETSGSYSVKGRWYTDSGATIDGTQIVLISISLQALGAVAYQEEYKEALTLKEVKTLGITIFKLETKQLDDIYSRVGTFNREHKESLTLREYLTNAITAFKLETLQLGDILSTSLTKVMVMLEQFDLTEYYTRVFTGVREILELFTLDDILTNITTWKRSLLENTEIGDIYSYTIERVSLFIENLSLGEILSKAVSVVKIEELDISDNLSQIITWIRARLESLSLDDIISSSLSKVVNVLESLTLTDIYSSIRTWKRYIIDSMNLDDVLTKGISTFKLETLNLYSSFVYIIDKVISIFEDLTIKDKITKAVSIFKLESFTLDDILGRISTWKRSLLENLELDDILSPSIQKLLTLIENLTLLDKLSHAISILRLDKFNITDSVSSIRTWVRSYLEFLTLDDIVSVLKTTNKILNEAFILADSFARVFTAKLYRFISFTLKEKLSTSLEGPAAAIKEAWKTIKLYLTE